MRRRHILCSSICGEAHASNTPVHCPLTPTQNVRYGSPCDLPRRYPRAPTPNLRIMIRPLLLPMVLRTKHQRINRTVYTRAGRPHGEPPRSTLFNIFMDTCINAMNKSPSTQFATLFVDDIRLLARTLQQMQRAYNTSNRWAERGKVT